MKQDKVKYDFKAFGQAIKEARKAKGISAQPVSGQAEHCAALYRVH